MDDDDDLPEDALRKQRVLAHIERYRLTIPLVVARLFYPPHMIPDRKSATKSALKLLENLVYDKKIVRAECPGKDGERPTYYLPKGITPGEASVSYDISTLWFCLAGLTMRYRLRRRELVDLIPTAPHKNVRHCLEDVRGIEGVKASAIVHRMFITTAEVKEAVRHARQKLKETRKKVGPLIDNGDYGFAILCDTQAKVDSIKWELDKPNPDGGSALTQRARYVVEMAPRAESLAEALNGWGGGSDE